MAETTPHSLGAQTPRAMEGIACAVGGMAFFVVQDGMMKSLLQDYTVWQLILTRGVAAIVLLVPLILWFGRPHRLLTPLWRLHLLRAALLSSGFAMFYGAFPFMGLAEVSTIFFSAPLMIALLAALWLGESIGPHRIGALVVGFAGVLLIIRPGLEMFTIGNRLSPRLTQPCRSPTSLLSCKDFRCRRCNSLHYEKPKRGRQRKRAELSPRPFSISKGPKTDLPVFGNDCPCLDRQLHRGKAKRLTCNAVSNAVDLEHHATRLHLAGPEVHGTFTFTHTNFDGLGGHRSVREDADPDATLTLHVTRHGTTGGFDLTCGDTLRLQGLQAIGAKV